MSTSIDPQTTISKLNAKPGDIIVVTVDPLYGDDFLKERERLRAMADEWLTILPEGINILITTNHYDYSVHPDGCSRIIVERDRQVTEERFDRDHDAQWVNGELAIAAAYYALPANMGTPIPWPWAEGWNKKGAHNRIHQLTIAGALIAAEIDRLYSGPLLRLWLDDARPAPDGWTWAKTYDEAISLLTEYEEAIISLDYDLGLTVTSQVGEIAIATDDAAAKSGYDVARWIEERVRSGELKQVNVRCHSENPTGRQLILDVIESIDQFYALPY